MPIDNNKRKFDFSKDYSHLSPEDQAIRSRLRGIINGFRGTQDKNNITNLSELLSRCHETNMTALPNHNQGKHAAIKKYILESEKNLDSLSDEALDILKSKISKYLNDEKDLASTQNSTILKTIKNIFENLLDISEQEDDTFIFKDCKPYLKIDNEFFNELLEKTTSANMIDLIQSKEIALSDKNIQTLWDADDGLCNVQLELLKAGYLDNQNKITDIDIQDFYGIIVIEDEKDQAFVNEFKQAFEQMQSRRKQTHQTSNPKLKRSRTHSCLTNLS